MGEICSKFTLKTPEDVVLVSLLLILDRFDTFSQIWTVSFVDLKQVNTDRLVTKYLLN